MVPGRSFVNLLLGAALLVALSAGTVWPAEIDDSNLFVEAFTAYQKKDYLLSIEKLNQLTQVFPDTPLRDVALLLLARSGWRSGDNLLAAKSVNQFTAEFPSNSLRSSIEEELLTLGSRLQKGEKIPDNANLRTSAVKVRNEQLAMERAAAERLERERQARVKAEQERLVREKAETERRERERLAAEKAAKENILAATGITVDQEQVVAAGQNGLVHFEIANRTTNNEEYILESGALPEYGVTLAAEAQPGVAVSRVTLRAGMTFKGVASFRMPLDRVDGDRKNITIRTVSARFSDVALSKDALVIAAAPLVRVVARPLKQKVIPGEQVSYRVTVLNIGSVPAQGLTVRAILPPQFDFLDAMNTRFRHEGADAITIKVDGLETGKTEEFYLNLKVREDSRRGQELRCQVEIVNGQLQRKDIFTSTPVTVQGI
jgi:uncharacterized repeat protein (TIGR01451 family)